MSSTSDQLEQTLASCLPGAACNVLVLDLAQLTEGQGSDPLDTSDWPEPWRDSSAHEDASTRTWWIQAPEDLGRGWASAFPVWLCQAAGARSLLILAQPSDQEPAPLSPLHLTDVVDLTQQSPLIGLGPSPRGPLFPDRTRLLDPDLTGELQALIKSTPAIAADTSTDPGNGPWQVLLPRISIPLAAAAHVGLPAVALALAPEDRSLPWDAIIQTLAAAPASQAP
ncbi:MAG: hypothetical protein CMJ86_00360 [Planctomycetes bacterium]|nr:hypothetical protein [Planctomycetota bacterium]